MNQPVSKPQLFIRQCNPKGSTFAHCLICSTAPRNAEGRYREELENLPTDYSLAHLKHIKKVLKEFIESKWENSGEKILEKVSIVLNIHGFNVPLANLEENTYKYLEEKFEKDTANKSLDDFVLFINFSWTSEQVITSQFHRWWEFYRWEWVQAIPIALWVFLIFAVALAFLCPFSLALTTPYTPHPTPKLPGLWLTDLTTAVFRSNLLHSLGWFLVGLVLCLAVLRLAVYFRDRDRADKYGVFDAIELVRWLHVILDDILDEKTGYSPEENKRLKSKEFFGTANLSFIAHSMGCFVATQAIRVLSDVFDPSAIMRWKAYSPDGPFDEKKEGVVLETEEIEKLRHIGKLFKLKSLVLASPDIPIWAITTGRSNFLRTCLRRFKEAYLFTNDADMVLRLASTVANYFVFPSRSRIGGYRLGNLTCIEDRKYGEINLDDEKLGVRACTGNIKLKDYSFCSPKNTVYQSFTIVDCTDYQDRLVAGSESDPLRRRLSALTTNNLLANQLNYILTAICHFSGIGQIDSHGGYFRGQFCLDLLYALALDGKETTRKELEKKYGIGWEEQLKKYQIAWIETSDDKGCNAAKA